MEKEGALPGTRDSVEEFKKRLLWEPIWKRGVVSRLLDGLGISEVTVAES